MSGSIESVQGTIFYIFIYIKLLFFYGFMFTPYGAGNPNLRILEIGRISGKNVCTPSKKKSSHLWDSEKLEMVLYNVA